MAACMADHLLPPNATILERHLAATNAALGELPTPIRSVVDTDTCPPDLLPWLASYMSVDAWDVSWSEEQKRAAIKNSIDIHRRKGTIGAVRRALAAVGFGAQLQEWFNQIPPGPPYTYRLLLNVTQSGINREEMLSVNKIVDATTNLRSHLETVVLTVETKAISTVGAALGIGHEFNMEYAAPDLEILMVAAAEGMQETEAAIDALLTLINKKMTTPTYW